jgi:HD-GYP domain-containing protein (c-di-GMP phosphodiesterase class II)
MIKEAERDGTRKNSEVKYDTDLIDSYIKKCSGNKWKNKNNKDESVKSIIGVIMYAHGASFKETGQKKIDKEREEGKNEILEKIQNSNLSGEFLQEISRTLRTLQSYMYNNMFGETQNNSLDLGKGNLIEEVDEVKESLNQSIEFIMEQQRIEAVRDSYDKVRELNPKTNKEQRKGAIEELRRDTGWYLNGKTLDNALDWENKKGADEEKIRLNEIRNGLDRKYKEIERERQQQRNSKRGSGSAER